MTKEQWLRCWGYTLDTPEAEAAWAAKLAFRPSKAKFIIGRSADYNYTCPVTNKPITSKHAHEENLKQQDCRVLESGETEASSRARIKADEDFERRVDETVEREIDRMPSEKREKLAAELTEGNLSVEVVRN